MHSGNSPATGANPLEAPKKYTDRFPHITDPNRRIYAGINTISVYERVRDSEREREREREREGGEVRESERES